VARAARELQGSSARSVKSVEWSLSNGLLYFQGKIYVPDTSHLRRCIVALSHDSRLAGHGRRWKTLELVSRNYWWPQMSRYVGRYVSTCDMCLWTKSFQHPLIGELHLFLFHLLHGTLSVWTSSSSCHNLQDMIPSWSLSIHHKACTFCFHCHYDLCRRSHTPFPQPCVETSRSPSESRLR